MQHTASKTPGLLSFFKPLAFGLALFATLSTPLKAAEEIPNYTLEVIVFETFALKSWTEEYWPQEIIAADAETALNLNDLLNGALKSPALGNKTLAVRKAPLELKKDAAKLTPQRGYRILFHEAWTQNTGDDTQMPKFWIDNASGTGSMLSGTVKLYKTRYAHVDFDLELERRIPARVKNEFLAHQKIHPTDVIPDTWRFKLEESRKIRPGQLHYIDHPHFGVLVQLTYNGPAK